MWFYFDWLLVVFFFFQAEDGIRDSSVTGVQTCALPIWIPASGEAQRQVDPPVAKQLPDLDHFTLDLDPVEGIQKRAVQLARLKPGQVGGDAQVRTVPEPEVRHGVRPFDLVRPRGGEDLCIRSPRVLEQLDPLARLDGPPAALD